MASSTKPRASSCFSFLKDALLLPIQNPKLFLPVFLLVTFPTFLAQITNVLVIQPFAATIFELLNKMKNMDPTSAEFFKLLEEIKKDVRELVIITVIFCITVFVLSFIKQIVAFFAASSTYSGERYSLSELVSKVIMKGHRIRGPLVTTVLISGLEFTSMFLLAALLQLVIGHSSRTFFTMVLFAFLFLAYLYFNVVSLVAMAVSVADTERRGVSALQQAWRLMTQVRPKEGFVLMVVIELLSMAPSPLYAVALVYAKQSMAIGLALLSVYALLSSVVQLFYLAAAMVYYYQATTGKDMISSQDYVKIPNGEANA